MSTGRHALIGGALAVAIVAAASASSSGRTSGSAGDLQVTAGFLEPGHCYRMAFPVDGPPNYKVLDRLEGGWVRAEVDAGPASAKRTPMWINTTQIITAREVECSQ